MFIELCVNERKFGGRHETRTRYDAATAANPGTDPYAGELLATTISRMTMSSSRHIVLRGLLMASLIAMSLFWLFVVVRVATGQSNHIGFTPIWFSAVLVVALALAAITGFGRGRQLAMAIATFAVLSIGGLYVLDRYNVLVPYETWLKRGMPERWERSRQP